jgi:hypothetical protein
MSLCSSALLHRFRCQGLLLDELVVQPSLIDEILMLSLFDDLAELEDVYGNERALVQNVNDPAKVQNPQMISLAAIVCEKK